jgi:hypothetical protein
MNDSAEGGSPELGRKAVEDELLDRVKQVARRIVERVKKLTEDTAPAEKLGDGPTDEAPPVG